MPLILNTPTLFNWVQFICYFARRHSFRIITWDAPGRNSIKLLFRSTYEKVAMITVLGSDPANIVRNIRNYYEMSAKLWPFCSVGDEPTTGMFTVHILLCLLVVLYQSILLMTSWNGHTFRISPSRRESNRYAVFASHNGPVVMTSSFLRNSPVTGEFPA